MSEEKKIGAADIMAAIDAFRAECRANDAAMLKALESIMAKQAEQDATMAAIRNTVNQPVQAPRASGKASVGPAADSAALDGANGDPVVKWDPKKWTGASEAGRRMSECSPEYLDAVAGLNEWKAANPLPGKEQYADRDRETASLARGWAKRKRDGWNPAPAHDPTAAWDAPPPDDDAPLF